MEIKETLSKGLQREFDVTIPAKDIDGELVKRLEKIGKRAKVPGFRPGKIPLSILKQRYQSEALPEAIEACVNDAVDKLLDDKKLKPAIKPNVELKSYEDGKDLSFFVKFDILPSIESIKLDGLSFEKWVVKVPPKSVDEVIKTIAHRNQKTKPLEKPRKSKKGDVVIIDFVGFVGKDPVEGGSGEDYQLELGSNSFIPGFEDQLTGKDKGDQVDVDVTFPEEYHSQDLAGKKARFDVKIKDIHEAEAVKLDDEFAKTYNYPSLDKMKEAVEQSLSHDFENKSFLNTKRHVLDALADRFTFEVPPSMVELEFKNIWEQLCHELGVAHDCSAQEGHKQVGTKTFEETAGKSEKELREEYQAIAERRVRLGILLAEIGNRNSIEVTNQELLQALNTRARDFPGQEQQVFDYYRNNTSAMASLRAPIFENKVVNYILSVSKVKEKEITPEELEKLLAKEEEAAEKKIASQAKGTKKAAKKKSGEKG